jgi:hypothetical protein
MIYKAAPWILGAVAAAIVVPFGERPQTTNPAPGMTACDLRAELRDLWADHADWTRMYLVTATRNLQDKEATAERLMKNQADLGGALEPYYGDAAGARMTALLKGHITIATQIVDAAMSGDDAKKAEAAKRWQGNADEIAAFLSEANPKHWPPAEMQKAIRAHLDHLTAQVAAHVAKDWKVEIAAHDKGRDHLLKMADTLAGGIAAQFPQKVK